MCHGPSLDLSYIAHRVMLLIVVSFTVDPRAVIHNHKMLIVLAPGGHNSKYSTLVEIRYLWQLKMVIFLQLTTEPKSSGVCLCETFNPSVV
jgi:hypothetical protein